MNFSTNFTVRTDLADESVALLKQNEGEIGDGIVFEKRRFGRMEADVICVKNKQGEEKSGKPIGTYLTFDVGEVWKKSREELGIMAASIGECIGGMLSRGLCLIVCLGNDRIIADAVGPMTAKNVIVTRHIKRKDKDLFDSFGFGEVSCVVTGVMGDTGAEAAEIVKGIIRELKPERVIVVDALAGSKLCRLAKTVQITDTGICPGSGVGNNREEISKSTMGVPVIAIGVPTVVETASLCVDLLSGLMDGEEFEVLESRLRQSVESSFVCPKETDKIIYTMSKLIGYSLNFALHEGMTMEEMDEFLA